MVRQRKEVVQEPRLMTVRLDDLGQDRPRERAVRAREIEVHLHLGFPPVLTSQEGHDTQRREVWAEGYLPRARRCGK